MEQKQGSRNPFLELNRQGQNKRKAIGQCVNQPIDHSENAPDYGLFRNITLTADSCMEHFLDEVRRSPKNNYCVSSIDLQNCFSGLYELVNDKIYGWKDKYDVRFC